MKKQPNFNKYDSVVNWLFSQLPMYQHKGKSAFKKNLDNIISLCDALDNPHDKYPTIHIAGTNGKGTTAHLIAAGLSSSGLKVGLYTSPHYLDYRERVKINGELMEEAFVISFVESNFDLIEKLKPSFFEITVALAFQYFYEQEVDIAVIETGLGGRLDSTNIITPILSIITNISLDHESMLGDNIHDIAIEKAGIIKPEIPIIIGEHQEESDVVFNEIAKEQSSDLYFVQDEIELEKIKSKFPIDTYKVDLNEASTVCKTDLLGEYQKYNIATALYSLDFLSRHDMVIDFCWDLEKNKSILTNLYQSWRYMGRFQILGIEPVIIADSAHNTAGIKAVMKTINKYKFDNIHFVLGFVNDKTLDKILPLFSKKANYYFVNANIPRALNSEILRRAAQSYDLKGESYMSVEQGYAKAKELASPNDLIYIGGSIFVLAEVIGAYDMS